MVCLALELVGPWVVLGFRAQPCLLRAHGLKRKMNSGMSSALMFRRIKPHLQVIEA